MEFWFYSPNVGSCGIQVEQTKLTSKNDKRYGVFISEFPTEYDFECGKLPYIHLNMTKRETR